MKFVTMRHPDLDGTATSTEGAFNDVWGPRGWVLADEDAAEQASTEESEPDKAPDSAESNLDEPSQGGTN